MGQMLCPRPPLELEILGGTGDPNDYYTTIGETQYEVVEQGKKPKRPTKRETGLPKITLRFW